MHLSWVPSLPFTVQIGLSWHPRVLDFRWPTAGRRKNSWGRQLIWGDTGFTLFQKLRDKGSSYHHASNNARTSWQINKHNHYVLHCSVHNLIITNFIAPGVSTVFRSVSKSGLDCSLFSPFPQLLRRVHKIAISSLCFGFIRILAVLWLSSAPKKEGQRKPTSENVPSFNVMPFYYQNLPVPDGQLDDEGFEEKDMDRWDGGEGFFAEWADWFGCNVWKWVAIPVSMKIWYIRFHKRWLIWDQETFQYQWTCPDRTIRFLRFKQSVALDMMCFSNELVIDGQ